MTARVLTFPGRRRIDHDDDQTACAVVCPHDSRTLRCSQAKGHDGPHVAGGPNGETYSTWWGDDTTKGDDDGR